MTKRILIVDDDKLILKSLEKLFKKEGYEISCALSGKEALERIEQQDFDLAIVDIRMPGLDGIATIERIRSVYQKKQKSKIPEIIITGYASEETQRKAEDLGIVDYIYKPFDITVLMEAIKRNLKNR